jgi:hypothetical protein
LTDIVVVVPFRSGGHTQLGVLAPVFDAVFTSKATGRPLDLLQALALVRTHRAGEIGAEAASLSHRWVLAGAYGSGTQHSMTCAQLSERNDGCGITGFMASGYASQFSSRGLTPGPAGFIELMSRTRLFNQTADGVPPSTDAAYRRLRVGHGDRVSARPQ